MSIVDKIQGTSVSLFVLLGLGLGAGYYYSNQGAIEDVDKQIELQKAEMTKREGEVKEAQRVASDKKKFEEDVNRVSDQLRAALEFLPNSLKEQEVLTRISNEARSAGVNPTAIVPKKPTSKAFYEELLMDVEMEGTYPQLVMFLAYISKIQRIVNIRGLELKVKEANDDAPILKLKGTLVAYRYLEGK
jgi:Tfp pilus assembly protein PilO